MTREQVYKIIDGERDYQDKMTQDPNSYVVPEQSTGDRILSMQYNLDKARDMWYPEVLPHQGTMEYIRKVVAIGIKLIEERGCPERKMENSSKRIN